MSYRLRIVALWVAITVSGCQTGTEPPVNTPPVPTPPASPTALTATAVSSSFISLTWTDASSDETGFTIERCEGLGCTSFTLVLNVGPNIGSYADITRAAGTVYRYRVRASNGAGTSAYSNVAEATTLQATASPTAPSGLTVGATSSSSIRVDWTDNADNEDGVHVQSCQGAGCTSFVTRVTLLSPNGTTVLMTDLLPGTTYVFRVRAYNGAGSSTFSNTATGTTVMVTAPPASPSGLVATATSSARVSLTWVDNANNEDGYRIERCQGAGCTNFATALITTNPNGTNTTLTTLTASTTYRFRVVAYNGAGASAPSAVAEATTPAAPPPPAAPTGLTATAVGSDRINLSWTDAASNEDGYRIERCQGAGCTNFAFLATMVPNAAGYSNTGLAPGTSYSYRVYTYNGGGNSPFATASATTAAQTSPRIGLSDTVVSFTAPQGGANPPADTVFITNSGAGTLTGLSASLGYAAGQPTGWLNAAQGQTNAPTTMVLRATTGARTAGTYTATLTVTSPVADNSPRTIRITFTVTPLPPPAAPTGLLAAAVSSSQINLSWQDVSTNETAFKVDRCAGAGCTSFVEIASLAAGSTSYQNTGLTSGTTYAYRVRAFNTAGSAPSNVVTATTFAASPLIVLSPTSRSFTGTAGGASPASQAVQVSNGGGGTLNGLSRTISYQAGQATGWLTASLSGTIAPVTLTLTVNPAALAAGTYNASVAVHASAATNTPQTVTVTFTVAQGTPTTPTTLRIINDLPGGVIGGANWTQLNTVIRVRVGPTSNAVIQHTSQSRELLFNGDETSNPAETLQIPPGSQATLNVSSQPGNYWLYIQTGWWELFSESGLWVKHMGMVMACDGINLAYKWVAIPITPPFGAPEEIRLSQFLPAGSYGDPFCG